MPLYTLSLLSLRPSTPLPLFLASLNSSPTPPLLTSLIHRWIILPTTLSTPALLAQNIHWDLLVILPAGTPLPPAASRSVAHEWRITAGLPSRVVRSFSERNRALVKGENEAPSLEGLLESGSAERAESSQALELSDELKGWIREFYAGHGPEAKGAVSMLNLLAFKEGMKGSYLRYGKAFAESIGSRHGGDAKIVGTVVRPEGEGADGDGAMDGWDEVAVAHYPSIMHFAEMLASRDYQEVNHEFRLPSLKDTCILMTSEVGLEEMGRKEESVKGKL
ncbi:hypothetical protein BS50DRAFT_269210 [Corynespora cassiicola Philippines]|uniref:EthD domain-containing protein n=1 Tax=Corynespora cassiicola Philippines TaxID=1448308 RepID=A0A2T2NZR2_CORCC|nr:hypothetical protein BS50DRAFT_269210 [Corynespora cassiicola Philippines]